MHHRDVKRRIVLPSLLQDEQRAERLKAADHDEGVEVILLELGGDGAQVYVRQLTVRAELGPATRRPVVDAEPGELVDVVVEETWETVVDGEGFVALADTVTDGCSRGGVHTTGGGTDARITFKYGNKNKNRNRVV